MTDHDPTPDAELASATLDDEVTAAERARVDASPELTAEVRAYAELRTRLAAVEIPAIARDSAVAAALAAFDEFAQSGAQAGESTSEAGGAVVALAGRRPRRVHWLGAAAAAVAVVAIGLVAINSGRSDDGRTSSAVEST